MRWSSTTPRHSPAFNRLYCSDNLTEFYYSLLLFRTDLLCFSFFSTRTRHQTTGSAKHATSFQDYAHPFASLLKRANRLPHYFSRIQTDIVTDTGLVSQTQMTFTGQLHHAKFRGEEVILGGPAFFVFFTTTILFVVTQSIYPKLEAPQPQQRPQQETSEERSF